MKQKVILAFFLAVAVSTVVAAGALPKSPLFDSLSNYVSGGRGDVFGSVMLSRPASDRATVRVQLDRGAPNHFYSIEIFEALESCAGTNCNRPFDDFAAVSKSFTTDASGRGAVTVSLNLPYTPRTPSIGGGSWQTYGDGVGTERLIVVLDDDPRFSPGGGDKFASGPLSAPVTLRQIKSVKVSDFQPQFCGADGGPGGRYADWGALGVGNAKTSDINERLEVVCSDKAADLVTPVSANLRHFALLYTKPGEPRRKVGICPWDGGCNSLTLYYLDNDGDNFADCFLSTTWISKDYDYNDVRNGVNTLGIQEPFGKEKLDWARFDFVMPGSVLSKWDIQHEYALQPPISCKRGGNPEGRQTGELSVAKDATSLIDPTIGPATDAFFDQVIFNLGTSGDSVSMEMTNARRPCDLDNDDDCDDVDNRYFASALGICHPDSQYLKFWEADIDGDGCVDPIDLEFAGVPSIEVERRSLRSDRNILLFADLPEIENAPPAAEAIRSILQERSAVFQEVNDRMEFMDQLRTGIYNTIFIIGEHKLRRKDRLELAEYVNSGVSIVGSGFDILTGPHFGYGDQLSKEDQSAIDNVFGVDVRKLSDDSPFTIRWFDFDTPFEFSISGRVYEILARAPRVSLSGEVEVQKLEGNSQTRNIASGNFRHLTRKSAVVASPSIYEDTESTTNANAERSLMPDASISSGNPAAAAIGSYGGTVIYLAFDLRDLAREAPTIAGQFVAELLGQLDLNTTPNAFPGSIIPIEINVSRPFVGGPVDVRIQETLDPGLSLTEIGDAGIVEGRTITWERLLEDGSQKSLHYTIRAPISGETARTKTLVTYLDGDALRFGGEYFSQFSIDSAARFIAEARNQINGLIGSVSAGQEEARLEKISKILGNLTDPGGSSSQDLQGHAEASRQIHEVLKAIRLLLEIRSIHPDDQLPDVRFPLSRFVVAVGSGVEANIEKNESSDFDDAEPRILIWWNENKNSSRNDFAVIENLLRDDGVEFEDVGSTADFAGALGAQEFDFILTIGNSQSLDAVASELYQKAIGAGSAVESVSFQNHSDHQVAAKIIQFIHEALARRRQ